MKINWHKLIAPSLGIPIGLTIFYFYRLWMVPIPIEVFERHVTPNQVTAGTHVTVTWKEIRTNECNSVTYRSLVASDGTTIIFEPTKYALKPIGHSSGGFTFIVPEFVAEGDLKYRVKTQFFCNFVQEWLGGPWLPLQDLTLQYVAKVD